MMDLMVAHAKGSSIIDTHSVYTFGMNRRILDKLIAAMEIQQGAPEINDGVKPEPTRPEVETGCMPFRLAFPKLYPWVHPPTEKCNERLLIEPMAHWPCVCLKGDIPFPTIEPDRWVYKISCVGVPWNDILTNELAVKSKDKICKYVKLMVRSGCLIPNPKREQWAPLRIVGNDWANPTVAAQNGDEWYLLRVLFDTQFGDNPCTVCLQNMMAILYGILRQMADASGVDRAGVDAQIGVFMRALWLHMAECLEEAVQDGGAIA
jgi:hypothetical protein